MAHDVRAVFNELDAIIDPQTAQQDALVIDTVANLAVTYAVHWKEVDADMKSREEAKQGYIYELDSWADAVFRQQELE